MCLVGFVDPPVSACGLFAEPFRRDFLRTRTLFDEGLITERIPRCGRHRRVSPQTPLSTRAVLGYLLGHLWCLPQRRRTDLSAQLPSFAYPDVVDLRATVRQMLGQPSRWQAPGKAEGTLLIDLAFFRVERRPAAHVVAAALFPDAAARHGSAGPRGDRNHPEVDCWGSRGQTRVRPVIDPSDP